MRALASADREEIPGVSMSVAAASPAVGQSTTSRSTCSAAASASSSRSSPRTRRTGSGRRDPSRACSTTRGTGPCRYQVTTRVHSPASVGAIRSPTSALSSVDLPALTRPARATRSGSSSRSCSARTRAAATGWSR